MNLKNLLTDVDAECKGPECKGLIFRGHYTQFMNRKGHFGEHQGLRLLKRKACPGCEKCGPLLDDAAELSCDDEIKLGNIVDGALYTLEYQNIGTDWETGYVDEFDIVAVMLPEEQQDRAPDFHGRYTKKKEKSV